MKFRTAHDTPGHPHPTCCRIRIKYITKVGRSYAKPAWTSYPNPEHPNRRHVRHRPRPALWNQDDLWQSGQVRRNDVLQNYRLGQINGRDELEIPVKAKLDGEYVEKMSFLFDIKCFFGTIAYIFRHEGVVEGGTGELNRKADNQQNQAVNK